MSDKKTNTTLWTKLSSFAARLIEPVASSSVVKRITLSAIRIKHRFWRVGYRIRHPLAVHPSQDAWKDYFKTAALHEGCALNHLEQKNFSARINKAFQRKLRKVLGVKASPTDCSIELDGVVFIFKPEGKNGRTGKLFAELYFPNYLVMFESEEITSLLDLGRFLNEVETQYSPRDRFSMQVNGLFNRHKYSHSATSVASIDPLLPRQRKLMGNAVISDLDNRVNQLITAEDLRLLSRSKVSMPTRS